VGSVQHLVVMVMVMTVLLMLLLLLLMMMMMTSLFFMYMQECGDQRLKRGTELLQNIKALKLFVWEQLMARRVEEVRKRQLTFLFKAACLKAAMSE